MRIYAMIMLSLFFGCIQDKPVIAKSKCQADNDDMRFMVWIEGCYTGISSVYQKGKEPHPFPLTDHCMSVWNSKFRP